MKCVVTAGPTFEPIDQVRRITNFSTGRLGTELANHLVSLGHDVVLLIGQLTTFQGKRRPHEIQTFATTADLRDRLQCLAGESVGAVFHAAAVSDFCIGKVYSQSANGELSEVRSGKIPTSLGPLLAELIPTQKILPQLRGWFPGAIIVGWKYEVDGDTAAARRHARKQIQDSGSFACVVNGPAYGPGFGLIVGAGDMLHLPGPPELFTALESLLRVDALKQR